MEKCPTPSAVKQSLAARIREKGPIPFSEFMEFALYDPSWGYYIREHPTASRNGDFITSVSVHPLFGQCLAVQIAEMAERMGTKSFQIIEFGGGKGALCVDILKCLKEEFPRVYQRAYYRIVEVAESPSSFWEEVDRWVPECRERLSWLTPTEWNLDSSPFSGCVLAQEFLDALPVHRVVRSRGDWEEIYVDYQKGSFKEVAGPLSSSDLREVCQSVPEGESLTEGAALEINLAAVRWLEGIAARLQQGYILILDYGAWGAPLLADTLSCYFRHTVHHNPYIRLGEQDMTTHVDFHSLVLAAQRTGLVPRGLVSQTRFLFNLGIVERASRRYDSLDSSVGLSERLALKTLTLPDGMGDRFWVFVLERSMGKELLRGLECRVLTEGREGAQDPVPCASF